LLITFFYKICSIKQNFLKQIPLKRFNTNKMDKKRVIISYHNLPADVLEALKEQYPTGFLGHAKKIPAPNPFYAITVDTELVTYLVKVDVLIDKYNKEMEDKDDDVGFDADGIAIPDDAVSDDEEDEPADDVADDSEREEEF
jgi:hypothetical protein